MATNAIDYTALAKKMGAVSSTPAPQAGTVNYAALASKLGGTSSAPPGVPKAPIPAGLQGPPAPSSPAPKVGTIADTLGTVGTHLNNMVTGTMAAIAPPQNTTEKVISALGPPALPAYRMLVKPSIDAVGTSIDQYKKGNIFSKDEYDAQGNYKPSVVSSAMDAIPGAGPWSRSIENDAQQKGAVPALAGLGTDLLAPKIAAKVGGAALKATGKGALMASATPPSVKLAATRFLVPGKPGELLQSALKPGVGYGANVSNTLESALPDIVKANPNVQGVSGFAKTADAAKDAAFQPYNDMVAQYRPPAGGVGPVRPGSIYGGPIADAQNASIPAINRFESGTQVGPPSDWTAVRPNTPSGIVPNTAEKASLYQRQIPVATADAIREDANAKLNAFYAKTGGDQNAALSNPETARIKSIGDSTRQLLYPRLESDFALQPGTVTGLQQKFGQLSDVSDIANKREPVFARHDPVSLSQQLVVGHGGPITRLTNLATQRLFKNVTNSDALVNSALDRFQNPEETPLPPRPGLFPQMGSAIGKGLYGTGKVARALPNKLSLPFYAAVNPPKK